MQRILSLQTDSGGFAYWPGQREPHLWGSIYAAAALSLARTNGLTVPDDALSQASAYLKTQIQEEKRSPAFKAFAAYVLALNQALDRDTFNTVQRSIRPDAPGEQNSAALGGQASGAAAREGTPGRSETAVGRQGRGG